MGDKVRRATFDEIVEIRKRLAETLIIVDADNRIVRYPGKQSDATVAALLRVPIGSVRKQRLSQFGMFHQQMGGRGDTASVSSEDRLVALITRVNEQDGEIDRLFKSHNAMRDFIKRMLANQNIILDKMIFYGVGDTEIEQLKFKFKDGEFQ